MQEILNKSLIFENKFICMLFYVIVLRTFSFSPISEILNNIYIIIGDFLHFKQWLNKSEISFQLRNFLRILE